MATSRRDATLRDAAPCERRHKGQCRRGTPLAPTSFIVGRERRAPEKQSDDSVPEGPRGLSESRDDGSGWPSSSANGDGRS